ncbi:MAG TPA: hypothetical protein VIA10_00945 [Gaiellaceae bacterium]|jgi:hypothetical protein
MKIGPLLARLHELETDFAEELRALGERHAADHDVFHQCHTFALQCERHAAALQPVAARYGEDVGDEGPGFWSGLLESARRTASASLGRVPESSLLLLRDLRTLFLQAEECSITWVMAGQAAQAARDQELLDVVRTCHQETEIQVKWFVTRIKVASPQALVVG